MYKNVYIKNVKKTVFVRKRKQYCFLLSNRVENREKLSYESWQKPLKILDLRKIMC